MRARSVTAMLILGLLLAACAPGQGRAAPAESGPARVVEVTDSPSQAPSLIPTLTQVPSETPLPSTTPSPIPSDTATELPSATASLAPSLTFTPLPSWTPTRTATLRPMPTATSPKASVDISNYAFGPQNLTVKVGTLVTWKNQDADAHSVKANDGSWGSGSLAQGQTYSHTFTKAGTYSYHCGVHPVMTGSIIVMP